jgi:predicted acyltransferase
VKRFAFLDWTRGLAVLIMIQCHTFNSLTRTDLREGGAYYYSQFIGGMAAPLFLFMAGMTLAFQMDSLERREATRPRRWLGALRRAGYVWAIAYLFRLSSWAGSWPNAGVQEIFRVDILNCMGLGMAALAALAVVPSARRAQFALAAALLIAAAAPLVANLDWSGAPPVIHEYLAPVKGRGHFPFFPCASYIGFGVALGAILKRTAAERIEPLLAWCVPVGFGMALAAQYFSSLPYSIYPHSNFWTDSPALILIRAGICLLMLAGAYLWTEFGAGQAWSWMQALGKTSLMAYVVHLMLVYGGLAKPWQRALTIPQTAAATVVVTAAMVGLAAIKLWWISRRTPAS